MPGVRLLRLNSRREPYHFSHEYSVRRRAHSTSSAGPGWCWDWGSVWTVLIRVPLVLNADDHLDSDLAVDGLTLLDAVQGHWRWHYPGTPYMGILPMLTSYPQALVWGANPITLVSGGTIIWLLVVVATFWLACQGVRARGGRLGDRAAGVLLAGDDLAVGTNHGGAPADAGLAHSGVRGTLCLPDARRVAARGDPRALVRTGSLSRRDVSLHARGPGAGGGCSPGSRRERSRAGIGLAAVFLVASLVGLAAS